MSELNDFQSAYNAGIARDVVSGHGGTPFIVIPSDSKLEDLEKLLPKPSRKRGVAALSEADSFVRYVNQHKTGDTAIFASVSDVGASFNAIIDFHGKTDPAWGGHQATFNLLPTVEWSRWMGQNKKDMTQMAFCEFLEENQLLFTDPDGASLLELILKLEGKVDAKFVSSTRLQNGSFKFAYEEDVSLQGSAPGAMVLPAMVQIHVIPFRGGSSEVVSARLKYRLQDRKLMFRYETVTPHLIIKDCVDETVKEISTGTGITPLVGGFTK
jgi:uncharacterized protein YfdQ (DUF2303 family)